MDMELKEMIHPDRCPLLTSGELSKVIPDFVWTGGHSGQLLTDEQADKLEELWDGNELLRKASCHQRKRCRLYHLKRHRNDSPAHM